MVKSLTKIIALAFLGLASSCSQRATEVPKPEEKTRNRNTAEIQKPEEKVLDRNISFNYENTSIALDRVDWNARKIYWRVQTMQKYQENNPVSFEFDRAQETCFEFSVSDPLKDKNVRVKINPLTKKVTYEEY